MRPDYYLLASAFSPLPLPRTSEFRTHWLMRLGRERSSLRRPGGSAVSCTSPPPRPPVSRADGLSGLPPVWGHRPRSSPASPFCCFSIFSRRPSKESIFVLIWVNSFLIVCNSSDFTGKGRRDRQSKAPRLSTPHGHPCLLQGQIPEVPQRTPERRWLDHSDSLWPEPWIHVCTKAGAEAEGLEIFIT